MAASAQKCLALTNDAQPWRTDDTGGFAGDLVSLVKGQDTPLRQRVVGCGVIAAEICATALGTCEGSRCDELGSGQHILELRVTLVVPFKRNNCTQSLGQPFRIANDPDMGRHGLPKRALSGLAAMFFRVAAPNSMKATRGRGQWRCRDILSGAGAKNDGL
jgi:hypothetical protein